MREVMKANVYQANLGSLDRGEYCLMRQFRFPAEYDPSVDKITGADSDRCHQWDFAHATRATKEHTGRGDQGIGYWAQSAEPKAIFAFLIDILKTEEKDWTGFRIMGTVNRSNGYVVWTLQLFKNVSGVKEYSGDYKAPNINPMKGSARNFSILGGY